VEAKPADDPIELESSTSEGFLFCFVLSLWITSDCRCTNVLALLMFQLVVTRGVHPVLEVDTTLS